jgi:hypothetical protein
METTRSHFRLCSSCKKPLPFESAYYVCSVSTCNQKRTGLTFCSLPCFEAHVPGARHREAWAEEQRAPTREQWEREQAEPTAEAGAPAAPARRDERRIVGGPPMPRGPAALQAGGLPHDVLVVVSKLKAYVRARSGMNTSDAVVDVLSDIVREHCDAAIQKAAAEGRKTVMPRDF